MSGKLSEELKVATCIAREAGATVMRVYATDFSVSYKGKDDPVTQADHLANALIVKAIEKQFPADLIVAEESPPPSKSLTASRVWYVDPLDGTKEFIARNGEFSVMIGLVIDGRPQLGVVYRPDGDVLYGGIVGQEAWVEVNGTRKALVIDSTRAPSSMTLVVSRSHRSPLIEKICEIVGVGHEIISGSVGLKIGLIAEGKADLYLEPGPNTSVWDACGPEAILQAAGGQFTDMYGQQLAYGGTSLKNIQGLVATNGHSHGQVVAALASVLPSPRPLA